MQVWPGADNDGIDVGVADDFFPGARGARDGEVTGDFLGGLGPAVAHGDDLDAGDGSEARDVARPGVGAGTDQTDTDHGFRCSMVSGRVLKALYVAEQRAAGPGEAGALQLPSVGVA